jgi:hypothetical protein
MAVTKLARFTNDPSPTSIARDQSLFDELRRVNVRPPPKREADLVRYDYYFSHPEHRPRLLTRRQRRRRVIREG